MQVLWLPLQSPWVPNEPCLVDSVDRVLWCLLCFWLLQSFLLFCAFLGASPKAWALVFVSASTGCPRKPLYDSNAKNKHRGIPLTFLVLGQ